MRLVPFLLCALVALSACTDGFVSFPVTKDAQESLGDDVEIIRLDASNIASFSSPAQGHQTSTMPTGQNWDYKVGVGDILSVIVFDHPELTVPGGPQRSVWPSSSPHLRSKSGWRPSTHKASSSRARWPHRTGCR